MVFSLCTKRRSDNVTALRVVFVQRLVVRRSHRLQVLQKTNSDDDEDDNVDSSSSRQTDEEGDVLSSNGGSACPLSMLTEGTTSAGEWIGLTTNTEEGSSSSDLDAADQTTNTLLSDNQDHPFLWEFETVSLFGENERDVGIEFNAPRNPL